MKLDPNITTLREFVEELNGRTFKNYQNRVIVIFEEKS